MSYGIISGAVRLKPEKQGDMMIRGMPDQKRLKMSDSAEVKMMPALCTQCGGT